MPDDTVPGIPQEAVADMLASLNEQPPPAEGLQGPPGDPLKDKE